MSEVFTDTAEMQRDVPSIVAQDVHVTYQVFEDRRPRVRQLVAGRFKPRVSRQIRALRGVNLITHPGEAVGIVGHNGSGKSTFLRTIAGLLPTTGGAIYARSIPLLLGVSAALQPDISGRRNIYLGGTALGLSRVQLEDRLDDIIEFAGLREFIDMPLRAYSSGMKARLQFSIATVVTPDVLLIDEALSVGDEQFKRRSERRIQEMIDEAGTVLLVSHSLSTIQDICTRAIWIDHGQLILEDDPASVIAAYRDSVDREESG